MAKNQKLSTSEFRQQILDPDRVIFLDIDGVLNSGFWNQRHQKEISEGKLVDGEKVRLLSQLVKRTKAGLVLHSRWRFWFDGNGKPLRTEARYLADLLAEEGLQLLDMTPDLTTEEIRRTKKFSLVKADEILLWLKFHGSVSGWAVLEDLDLHREEFEGHQVKTDPWVGLTRKDIAQAEKILNAHMGRAHAPKA